jgi:hypothetical protein
MNGEIINGNDETKKIPSRRKFIFLGLSAVAFFSVFRFVMPSKKKKTIKMLTEDGRLVQIDEERLPSKGKKISNNELHNWIKIKK